MDPGVLRLERDMPRHYAFDAGSDCFPERDVLRPAAVGVDDIGGAQSEFDDREPLGVRALGQGARRRAHDGLPVSSRPQALRQFQERFLPAAPGFGTVNVDDGKRSQKMNVALLARVGFVRTPS